MALGINVGTRPPECTCLISADWEAPRKSLRPMGASLISGGKRWEGFRESGPRSDWKCWPEEDRWVIYQCPLSCPDSAVILWLVPNVVAPSVSETPGSMYLLYLVLCREKRHTQNGNPSVFALHHHTGLCLKDPVPADIISNQGQDEHLGWLERGVELIQFLGEKLTFEIFITETSLRS